MLTEWAAIVASVVTGLALELGVAAVSGRREAWDSGVFWMVGLPAALVVSCAIGYLAGRRGWFWTGLIVPVAAFIASRFRPAS